ncbi:MAG TPA: transglutaminase [Clostridiaceae bacterium]|nr:transglutaminase [Clostridiaceae bacterium]
MRLRKNKKIYRFYIIVCVLITLLLLLLANAFKYSDVNKKVVIEAGSELPQANVFIKDQTRQAEYISDITKIEANKPGTYDVRIESNGKKYKVKLEIRDTLAPEAEIKNIDLYEGRIIEPQEFIKGINDATNVAVTYKNTPDFYKTGIQDVFLLLEDEAGNKSEYQASLRVSKTKENIRVDIGNRQYKVEDFLKEKNDLERASIIEPLSVPEKMGTYPAKIKIDDVIYDSNIVVTDLTPPKGEAVEQQIWQNDVIEASQLVTNIKDLTSVTVRFKEQPDFSLVGEQTVKLILEDEANNQTELEAKLTVIQDTEPPEIYGVKDNTIYLNTPVSFKKGVYVYDNRDGEIQVQVDSSNVNQKKTGEYKVIYTATDSSGNTSSKEAIYTVKEMRVTMEQLEELADEILARITTPDMTLREKAWEIYQYVNKHLTYTGYSDKTDWMFEAYNGITNAVGDCFTYFAMSELLLNRIGMETMRVERLSKPGEAKHYWHLVDFGEGWYHFDACIHIPKLVSFMLTDAEMDAFSARVGKDNYYYRFDKSNYPRTPEKYNYPRPLPE